MEMPGIEPGAFHMQSERSTTEPHPLHSLSINIHIIIRHDLQGIFKQCTHICSYTLYTQQTTYTQTHLN